MSDENNIGMWATMFGSMLAWIGINTKWTHALQKRVNKANIKCAETFTSKEDFNHRIDRLEDTLKADINRLYDALERRMGPRGD